MARAPPREKTTLLRTCLAVPAGVLAGVGFTVAFITGWTAVAERVDHVDDATSLTPVAFMAQSAFLLACSFALYILLVSTPLWWLIRAFGRGGWASAAILGFLATLALWLLAFQHTDHPLNSLAWGGPCSLFGAAAGWVMWRVAYRKTPSPPPPS